MAEKESPRIHELGDNESIAADEPDWQVRGDEHPLEGGQTDAVDEPQEEADSLADGSSYRKEADGLGDLIDDGSNYREIAKADD
jgi:hypothetical protein